MNTDPPGQTRRPSDQVSTKPGELQWRASALLFFLAPVPIAVAVRHRESWWRYASSSLLVPLVMVGVAYGIADERRWQEQALEVFAAYTHRFPEGRLGDRWVMKQYESVVDVCAVEGRDDPAVLDDGVYFCITTVMRLPSGEQVIGGWRQKQDLLDEDGDGFELRERYDCFGEAKPECS